jgi:hypothetical protein
MEIVPSLASKHVTPHSLRHGTAVHLVAAGVDITVIRSCLGHVSLYTTNHYAQANLETKRKALERVGLRPEPARCRDGDAIAASLSGSTHCSRGQKNVKEIMLFRQKYRAKASLLHIMSSC